MSFEGQMVMYADQGLAGPEGVVGDPSSNNVRMDLEEAERKFMHFIQETQERNTFIYR